MRFLYLFLVILCLSGCSKRPIIEVKDFPLGITAEQVRVKCDENFIFGKRCDIIVDSDYLIPSKEWIEQIYIPTWVKYRIEHKVVYRREKEDCDDFAMHARVCAQGLSVEDKTVAVGLFFYKIGDTGHAINLIFYLDKDRIKPYFFEPQLNKEVFLSLQNLEDCIFWYF